MTYTIEKLSPSLNFGSLVRGLAMHDLNDPSLRKRLHDLWIQEGVVVFRERTVDTEFQIALSRCFGELERHPQKEIWVEGHPDLIEIKYTPEAGGLYEVNGVVQASWIPWHADLIYTDRINHGGILRAMKIASRGGMTGFVDGISLYETLPEDIRNKIEDRKVVYQMRINVERNRFATRAAYKRVRTTAHYESVEQREDRDFPPSVHPLVYTQRETGRKVLNFSPLFAVRVLGMDAQESDELLFQLLDHMSDSKHAYHHAWQPTDMVLWDNWRIRHSVTGAPPDEPREMQRTTIAGDYQLGEKLETALASA